MEHRLRAKKIELTGEKLSNVDIRATFESKGLLITCGKRSVQFSYKKIKHTINGPELVVQSDGLKMWMDRSFVTFEQQLLSILSGGDVSSSQKTNVENKLTDKNSRVNSTVKGNASRDNKSHVLVLETERGASVPNKKNILASPPLRSSTDTVNRPSSFSSSPVAASLKAKPDTASFISDNSVKSGVRGGVSSGNVSRVDGVANKQKSIANVFRPQQPHNALSQAQSVHTVHTNSTTTTDNTSNSHALLSNTTNNDDSWFYEDGLDLSTAGNTPTSTSTVNNTSTYNKTNNSNTSTVTTAKTPVLVTYGKARFDSARALLSPTHNINPARTLFGSTSGSSGSTNNTSLYNTNTSGGVTDGTPHRRLFEPHTTTNSTTHKPSLFELLKAPKKDTFPTQTTHTTYNTSAWDEEENVEEWETGNSAPLPLPAAKPGFSIMDTFRKYSTNTGSGTSSTGSSGITSSIVSSRIPGGIRNLGNSCYIASVLQALFSLQELRDILLSPFWTSLVAQQCLNSSSVTATNNTINTTTTATTDTNTTHTVDTVRPVTPPLHTLTTPHAPPSDFDSDWLDPSQVSDTAIHTTQTNTTTHSTTPTTYSNVCDTHTTPPLNTLEKYSVHSVLVELTKLFRQKSDLQNTSSTSSTTSTHNITNTTSSFISTHTSTANSTVLDVTRLKRAMVHHTHKFAGYSQQDAQEFLSDLLDTLEGEMRDRFAEFAGFALVVCGAGSGSSGGGGVSDNLSTPAHTNSTSNNSVDVNKLEHKRRAEELNAQTVKKSRVCSEDGNTDQSIVYHSVQPTPLRTTLHTTSNTTAATTNIVTPDTTTARTTLTVSPCSGAMQSVVQVQLTCVVCGDARAPINEQYQHFPLDINNTYSTTNTPTNATTHITSTQLSTLLSRFFQDETRELTCKHCNSSSASVHTTLTQLPSVLVLQLKRFEYDTAEGKMVKVHNNVDFPVCIDVRDYCSPDLLCSNSSSSGSNNRNLWSAEVETLLKDPEHFHSFWKQAITTNTDHTTTTATNNTVSTTSTNNTSNTRSTMYELNSVVRHIGSAQGAGHYICDARQGVYTEAGKEGNETKEGKGEEKWRRFDDSLVTNVTQDTVMMERDTPYLFFYTRR